MSDWIALLISYVYVFAMIGIAEALRKWRGYSTEFTRKFIHIGVGMWAYGTVLLFENRTFAVIPPLTFIVINAISYRRGTFQAMETGEKGRLGTIYFPISFSVAVWLLWDHPHVLVASLMPMTWGDALASVIGQRYGRRFYSILGSARSLEGSITMFLSSWIATLIPLILLSPEPLSVENAVLVSCVTAVAAAIIEGVSPWGIDNLTVPAVSALALAIMLL
ncbi:MAG: phosphatidate cytidylyltransferase [Anaerolineales bacterium]|nr:phosphatidate cytidylyltransferase [Anaerolineales bacterium]